VLLGVLGCSLAVDSEEFVILPATPGVGGASTAGMVGTGGNGGECWREGRAGSCDGKVPLRCSATGEWLPAGPACDLGCNAGVCVECSPETGMGKCGPSEGLRQQCSADGRWLEALPCGPMTPYCSEGQCVACGPNQRTCIDGVPQICGADGRWLAQTACTDGRACDPLTGACAACGMGELRGCANDEVRGNCGEGERTCLSSGAWSECSVAVGEDSCEVEGDDGNCDGTPNSPSAPCALACSAAVSCGPANETGLCTRGQSDCVGGQLQPCDGAIYPAPRDCRSMEDYDCNGTADALDDTCECRPGAEQPCESSVGDVGICQVGTQVCVLAPGGTATGWSACQGGVAPRLRQCDSALDNDCDGTSDQDSPTCECSEGSLTICSVGSCQGVQRCIRSERGDATYWGECELDAVWSFVNPEPLTGLGLAGDVWGPAPFDGGRYIAFSADEPENIYVAERIDGAAYGQGVPLTGVNEAAADGTPFVTLGGATLYFDSRRPDGGDRDLFRAGGGLNAWAAPELVASVNSDADDLNPWLSPDERLLIFTSDRDQDLDLWVAVSDGRAFGTPRSLVELNTTASEEGAVLTRDGLTIFFASNRPGSERSDVWVATRTGVDTEFSSPRNLAGVNSDGDELDLALGADGQELFFTSNRGGGDYRLYRAGRGCE
jgi:hypothetical protein